MGTFIPNNPVKAIEFYPEVDISPATLVQATVFFYRGASGAEYYAIDHLGFRPRIWLSTIRDSEGVYAPYNTRIIPNYIYYFHRSKSYRRAYMIMEHEKADRMENTNRTDIIEDYFYACGYHKDVDLYTVNYKGNNYSVLEGDWIVFDDNLRGLLIYSDDQFRKKYVQVDNG